MQIADHADTVPPVLSASECTGETDISCKKSFAGFIAAFLWGRIGDRICKSLFFFPLISPPNIGSFTAETPILGMLQFRPNRPRIMLLLHFANPEENCPCNERRNIR